MLLSASVSSEQKAAIRSWWAAFSQDKDIISRSFFSEHSGAFDIVAWMREYLGAVDPALMWEFGPGIKKRHRLVITPEARRELRPLVRYLLNEAPEFEDWEFYEYRLARDFERAQSFMEQRAGWKDITAIDFQLSEGRFGKIDVKFFVPFREPEDSLLNKLFILLETLLGEEVLDKWVGYIDVAQKKGRKFLGRLIGTKGRSDYNIINLAMEFSQKMALIKGKNPKNRYFDIVDTIEGGNARRTIGFLFKIDSKEQLDYPDKKDLFVAVSPFNEFFSATLDGHEQFYSERFSNNGEIFIYIKMDGSAGDLNQEIFVDRGAIEDALSDALEPLSLGCVVGGGTGRRYSYIDLAVTDLERSVATIQQVLRNGKLTKRSWILFHDADLRAEWIGVWDNSPMPYMG